MKEVLMVIIDNNQYFQNGDNNLFTNENYHTHKNLFYCFSRLFSTLLSKWYVVICFFVLRRRFIFIYIVIGNWHASEAVEVRMTKV